MKVYPGLIASEFFWYDEKYSFRVWLWKSQADLVRWAERYGNDRKKKGYYDGAEGLCNPARLNYDECGQHIAELHFVAGKWAVETVAHECLHGLLHFLRFQSESFARVFYQMYKNYMDWEEEICYPFGELVDQVYRWLWKKNPNPKWRKEKMR